MKTEGGFKPNVSKECACEQADQEEREGSSYPLNPAFTPEQLEVLRRLDDELETVVAILEGDPSKAADYAGELEEVLGDLQILPHREIYAALVEPLESELRGAWHAALKADGINAVSLLEESIKSAHAYLHALERHH